MQPDRPIVVYFFNLRSGISATLQISANLCKSVQITANLSQSCKYLLMFANLCKSLQSLQISASFCQPDRIVLQHSALLVISRSALCPRIVFVPFSRSILVRIISGYSVSLQSHYSPVSPLHPLCSLGSDCGIVLCAPPVSCFVLLSFPAPSSSPLAFVLLVLFGFVLSILRSRLYALHRFVLRALYPLSALCSRFELGFSAVRWFVG